MTKGDGKGKFYTGTYAGLDMQDIIRLKELSTCDMCKEPANVYVNIPVIQKRVCLRGCHKRWPEWTLKTNRNFITDKERV